MTQNALIKKLTMFVLCCLFFTVLLSGCSRAPSAYVRTSFALDTVVQVTVYDEKDLIAAEQALLYCQEMEKVFSRTDPESELYRLNEAFRTAGSAAGDLRPDGSPDPALCAPVSVSDDLFTVISDCINYSVMSGGAFDITLGALSSVYDFSGETHRVPTDEERAEMLRHTGYRMICLSEGNGVYLGDPETVLDLGAAAKGYIADRMKERLLESGVKHAIINLGGNVLVIGEKPSASGNPFDPSPVTVPYEAGISKPIPGQTNEVLLSVSLSDSSLVTSGTYQRCFEENGVIWHHILDPSTGLPVDNGFVSVSVLCKESEAADILSTACFVLGPEGAKTLIAQLDFPVEVIFIDDRLEVTRIHN